MSVGLFEVALGRVAILASIGLELDLMLQLTPDSELRASKIHSRPPQT